MTRAEGKITQLTRSEGKITQLTRAGGRPVFRSASTSMSVVLPAPEAPMRAVSTPGLKAPVMPCHTKTHASAAKQRLKPHCLWQHSGLYSALSMLCLHILSQTNTISHCMHDSDGISPSLHVSRQFKWAITVLIDPAGCKGGQQQETAAEED